MQVQDFSLDTWNLILGIAQPYYYPVYFEKLDNYWQSNYLETTMYLVIIKGTYTYVGT